MRRNNLPAVIACILGIVLLAALGLFILKSQKTLDERYDNLSGPLESELYALLTEPATEPVPSDGGAGETLPVSSQDLQTEAASGTDTRLTADGAGLISDGSGRIEDDANATSGQGTDAALSSDGVRTDPDGSSALPAHSILFAGDSRTLGLRDAQRKLGREDGDVFVGKVGEGCSWFVAEGMSELAGAIAQNPNAPVVLNFGVNDPDEIDNYIVAYWEIIRRYPDTSFYILSVNPIDETFILEEELVNPAVLETINSLSIARMNRRFQEEFGSRFLDSASYLRQSGFSTVDGLHYTAETYLKIHDYVVRELF